MSVYRCVLIFRIFFVFFVFRGMGRFNIGFYSVFFIFFNKFRLVFYCIYNLSNCIWSLFRVLEIKFFVNCRLEFICFLWV